MTGKELKKFRKTQLKITQAQMAEIMGVSRIAVSHWETGRFKYRDDIFVKLRAAGFEFETPVDAKVMEITNAVMAYRDARVIFNDHARALRMANQTLFAKNLPGFTRSDMNILFAEYPDILKA